MKECILCGEKDGDTVVEHHTIPLSINKNWKKTIYLCQKCHTKVHRHVIEDLVKLLNEIIDSYHAVNRVFEREGIFPVKIRNRETNTQIVQFLLDNVPLSHMDGNIAVKKVTEAVEILGVNDIRKKSQRVGFLLRALGIETHRNNYGMCIKYDRKTLEQLKVLRKALQLKSKEFPNNTDIV